MTNQSPTIRAICPCQTDRSYSYSAFIIQEGESFIIPLRKDKQGQIAALLDAI